MQQHEPRNRKSHPPVPQACHSALPYWKRPIRTGNARYATLGEASRGLRGYTSFAPWTKSDSIPHRRWSASRATFREAAECDVEGDGPFGTKKLNACREPENHGFAIYREYIRAHIANPFRGNGPYARLVRPDGTGSRGGRTRGAHHHVYLGSKLQLRCRQRPRGRPCGSPRIPQH